jgi:hypothetical protein
MAEQTPPNPKPPISEARRRANIRNAQASTGPRTEAGKNRSKFNNLRSCCYAKELIIPGESPEELQERCDRWVRDLNPRTEPEHYEVFNAVHATWRQDRMRRAEAIALADLVDKTTEGFHEQKEREARELIARLPESPGECVQGLRNSTAGLDWMIDQVGLLAQQVVRSGGLTQSQRRHLIHLCSKRPTDLFVDVDVATCNWLYLAPLLSQVKAPEDPAEVAIRELQVDRPPGIEVFEFEYRVKDIVRRLPPAEEAQAELKQILAALLEELTERRELIGLREQRDLARAIGKAKGDAGAETAKRQRVENSMDRQRRMSLKEFRALVNSRPEPGDDGPDDDGTGDGDGTPAAPGPWTEPDPGPAEPKPETNHDGGAPGEPGVTTATTGSVVMTGPAAPVAAPAEAVKSAPAGTTAEADTPQEFKSEPTCQNGRRDGDVVAEQLPSFGGQGAGLCAGPQEHAGNNFPRSEQARGGWGGVFDAPGCGDRGFADSAPATLAAQAAAVDGAQAPHPPCSEPHRSHGAGWHDDPHPPFGHPLPGGEGLPALTGPAGGLAAGPHTVHVEPGRPPPAAEPG